MSLPKKKSRLIQIDNTDYRYMISTSLVDDNGHFKLNATIQIAEGEGSALLINGLVTRDFWLDFSDLSRSADNYPIIQPIHIEKFIRRAIKKGWSPKKKSSQFSLQLDNKSVFN